jgi:hypothetical protein
LQPSRRNVKPLDLLEIRDTAPSFRAINAISFSWSGFGARDFFATTATAFFATALVADFADFFAINLAILLLLVAIHPEGVSEKY